jgi:sugar-specific transcriptional regulator TrmB
MDFIKELTLCGLTKEQATVYLALLKNGSSSVLSIARLTGLKRPTIYLILDDLIEKGAAIIVPGEKRRLFLALPPERFEEDMSRRLNIVRDIVPRLSATYKEKTARPQARFFESKEGILNVYREIAAEPNLKEILSFVSLEAISDEFEEIYEIFVDLYKKRRMIGREIIFTKNQNHSYIEKLRGLPNYKQRFVDSDHAFFTDNIIYNNKIATFSFKKRFAFVIDSEDVASSHRSLFELAWQAAQ